MFRKWSTSFCVYNIPITTHLQPEYTTNSHETRSEQSIRRRRPIHCARILALSNMRFPSTILWVHTYMQIPKNCAYTYTCNSLWHNNIHKMPTFALQKPYFCVIKTPFLHAKNHTFATQKPPFWLMPILLL